MLHDFIATHRQEIISRCHAKVAARLPVANEAEIYGVPLFLDQLMDVLRLGLGSNPAIAERDPARPRASQEGIHRVAGRARLW